MSKTAERFVRCSARCIEVCFRCVAVEVNFEFDAVESVAQVGIDSQNAADIHVAAELVHGDPVVLAGFGGGYVAQR